MLTSIIIFLSGIILLLPVLFWMYVVVGFSHYSVTRKEFFIGLGSGGIIASIFSPYQIPLISQLLDSIFYGLTLVMQNTGISLFFAVGVLFSFLGLLIFLTQTIYTKSMKKALGQSLVSFAGYLFVIVFSVMSIKIIVSLFPPTFSEIRVGYGEYIFGFFGAVVGYYIIIGLIEEGAKYFGSISTIPRIYGLQRNQFLLFGVCAALGFSFLENILYTLEFISTNGINFELIRLVFFRSIFALCLHIFCSLLMSFGFYYLYSKTSIGVIKTAGLFIIFTLLSIFSHMFFDVSLTYGYIGVVFFYVIALYLAMSVILESGEGKGLLSTES